MKLVLISVLIIYLIDVAYGQGEQCVMPNNEPGICQVLDRCLSLLRLYQENPRNREVINFLVQSQRNCGVRSVNRNPILCCQDNVVFIPDDEEELPQTPPPTPPTPPPTLPPTPPPTQPPPPPQPSSDCQDPDGVPGNCVGLKQCPIVLNEFLTRQKDQAYIRYIQKSNEKCNRIQQNVCCPLTDTPVGPRPEAVVPLPPPTPATPPPTPPPIPTTDVLTKSTDPIVLLTPDTGCGFTNFTVTRVVGGEPAPKGAFPWMALIGYKDDLGETAFKCGGSLITRRHVLTAAHCIKSTLSSVRLGEHDLETDLEALTEDIPVIKIDKHPNYDKKDGNSDLAILTLGRDVRFTSTIKPVCIPFQEPYRSKNYEKYMPFVAGWGRTQEGGKPSNVLQYLQITVFSNALCKEKYKAINKVISEKQFDNAVICAGFLKGGKDTCQGDSGGPLMAPTIINGKSYYHQIGVVSYGIGCARPEIPGVYARVQNFVNWIQEKISEPIP